MTSEPVDPTRSPLLRQLASAILAGEEVVWPDVARTTPKQFQGLMEQLKTLAVVSDFYRDLTIEPPAIHVGGMWGHLQIIERIGHGAFGQVFRAWDSRLHRDVALKLLPLGLPDRNAHDGVLAEARLLARVRHPNVVVIHGVDQIGSLVGIWMELVRGRTLDAEVKQSGPLAADDVVAIATDLCGALHAVHEAGLIHGDIKAQNVVREEGGRIVLMDFGAGQLRSAVQANIGVAGTPLYAAPEVFRGAPASPQSDLYSLGVLVYYLLRAEYPVHGRSLAEIQAAHGAGTVPPPVPAPAAVVQITNQLLSREPAGRPRTAADAQLEFARAARPAGRRWVVAAAIVAVAIVAGFLGRTLRGPATPDARPGLLATSRERIPITDDYLMLGRPTLDGRRLSYAELEGHPAFIDLGTMTSQRILTANRSEAMESSVPSPDGSQLAYAWYRGDEDVQELRVVATAGSDPRVLIPGGRAKFVVPLQWSRDTSQILALLHRETGHRDLVLVSARDGSERLLRRFETSEPLRPSLSPDDRFVVFDYPASPQDSNRDVFSLEVASGEVRALVSHPASDLYAEWTPDGAGVLFISDRNGATDAWLQRVANGRPISAPRQVAGNLGRSIYPMGLTRNGTYYYQLRAGAIDVFMARWNADGSIGTVNRLSSQLEGATAQPAWSPTGRHLAYIALRGPALAGFGANALVVRDLITGDERQLAKNLRFFLTAPKWHPDGSEILLNATDAGGRSSYYRVNVATGSAVPSVASAGGPYAWAADGRAVLYVARGKSVSRYELATGRIRTLLSADDGGVEHIVRFGESPLGGPIAYSGVARRSGRAPGTGWPSIRLWDKGRVIELVRGVPGERLEFQSWTPDGRAVLFTRFKAKAVTQPHALWVARADGSGARATGFEIDGQTQANGVVMHPLGEEIAFTVGGTHEELWRMSRFLP